MTKKLLMGNEAMAHAALEAGVGVVAGYPGTPSSEIVETIARQHARGAAHGVHVEWSTNEKAALEMLFGASLAGSRCLFTCKQMGLNVASDALLSLNYVSVRGGLVLIVADDPGPISSQTEQDTRRFAMFAKVPVLDPSTPEQAYDMVKAAFDLSERYHTPVIVRPTTRVDHASAFFEVQEETHALPVLDGGFQHDPSKWVIFPRRSYEAHGEINQRLTEIANAFSTEQPYNTFNPMAQVGGSVAGQPTFGIMTGGITTSYVREALRLIADRAREAGIIIPGYRLMQVGTPYPFPERTVEVFTAGLSDILVLEELDGVLEDQLAQFAGRKHANFNIRGRYTGDANDRGENSVDDIVARIERFLGLTGRLSMHRIKGNMGQEGSTVHLSARGESEIPARPPVLCAGCPHRGSFYATLQALEIEGKDAVLCGDIGCYTLGNAQPLDALDTCLCMGAGVTMAQGIAVADPDKKAIAYIGDSTFFASGETGISNAAYNGHDITVMVLDNSTTAMTGFQPHPGTGYTLMGDKNRPLSIEAVLKANGFMSVERTNPFDRDAAVDVVRRALEVKGPSAVIFEGACAQLTEPRKPVIINREICTGCKRCINAIGCPAITFNRALTGPRSRDRGQATIDTSLCNGCGLCTQVCPFHAIHIDSAVYRASVPNLAAEAGGWPTVSPDQQAKMNALKEMRATDGLSAAEAVAVASLQSQEPVSDAMAVQAADAEVPALAGEDERIGFEGVIEEEVEGIAEADEAAVAGVPSDEPVVEAPSAYEADEAEVVEVDEVEEIEVMEAQEPADKIVLDEDDDAEELPDLEFVPAHATPKPRGQRPEPMIDEPKGGRHVASAPSPTPAHAAPEPANEEPVEHVANEEEATKEYNDNLSPYHAAAPRKKAQSAKPARGKHAAPETMELKLDFGDEDDDDVVISRAAFSPEPEPELEPEPEPEPEVTYEIDEVEETIEVAVESEIEIVIDDAPAGSSADAPDSDSLIEEIVAESEQSDDPYSDYAEEAAPWSTRAGYDAWGSFDMDANGFAEEDDDRA